MSGTLQQWLRAACLYALCGLVGPWAAAANPGDMGAAIYRNGVLPSGQALRGERTAGVGVEGISAACITCHRPSGLGTSEGRIVIPPIIGKYLFRAHSTNVRDVGLPHVPGYRSTREPYTDASLAKAIREGVGPTGRQFSDLMPRYALDDASLSALVAYLKTLSAGPMPGVGDEVLHFATVITPDADATERQGMLDVMAHFFADKNAFIRGGVRPMQATREIEYRVSRRWQLHVWELNGPSETWEAQLKARFAAEPVFALISGLGRRTWAPVHRFCQSAHVPCLLPNIDLPVVAEADFYPVYFSGGVLLEAGLMAHRIEDLQQANPKRRLVQVFRGDDIGADAAKALEQTARAMGLDVEMREWRAQPADPLLHVDDATELLALWLRPADLARLPSGGAGSGAVLMSGLMAGLETAPLPSDWRGRVQMSYPADLPELRKVRMNFPLAWFKIHQLPVVAERVQVNTYVACGILAETLTDMLDSFVPEYLVERVEVMLSHRLVNGYFPRLSLAPGQRMASKGGYIARFNEGHPFTVVAEGDWTVP